MKLFQTRTHSVASKFIDELSFEDANVFILRVWSGYIQFYDAFFFFCCCLLTKKDSTEVLGRGSLLQSWTFSNVEQFLINWSNLNWIFRPLCHQEKKVEQFFWFDSSLLRNSFLFIHSYNIDFRFLFRLDTPNITNIDPIYLKAGLHNISFVYDVRL